MRKRKSGHQCVRAPVRHFELINSILPGLNLPSFPFVLLLNGNRCPSNLPPLRRAPREYNLDSAQPPDIRPGPHHPSGHVWDSRRCDARATGQTQLYLHNSCWGWNGVSWTLLIPLLQVVIKCWLTALFRMSSCGGVLFAATPHTTRFGLMVSAGLH